MIAEKRKLFFSFLFSFLQESLMQFQLACRVGRNVAAEAADSVVTLRGHQLEVVSHFKYLSSVFTSDCTLYA